MNTPDILFAVVQLLASMLAALVLQRARSAAKTWGFLAAALFAVFALAQILRGTLGEQAATLATLGTLSTAPVALTLAVFHRFAGHVAVGAAWTAFAVAAAAGLAGGYFAHPGWGLVSLMASVIALIVLGVMHLPGNRREAALVLASALALAAGGASFAIAGPRDFALFSAAALLGIALAVSPRSGAGVKKQTWKRRTLSVRRKG
jgi:hypothetical protein